jgi:hypothetical protein
MFFCFVLLVLQHDAGQRTVQVASVLPIISQQQLQLRARLAKAYAATSNGAWPPCSCVCAFSAGCHVPPQWTLQVSSA